MVVEPNHYSLKMETVMVQKWPAMSIFILFEFYFIKKILIDSFWFTLSAKLKWFYTHTITILLRKCKSFFMVTTLLKSVISQTSVLRHSCISLHSLYSLPMLKLLLNTFFFRWTHPELFPLIAKAKYVLIVSCVRDLCCDWLTFFDAPS